MKTRDVFISYSQEDKPTADAICAKLESTGVRCWIAPRDIQPGRSFAGEITRGVQASKIMVLVFSAHSNRSEQVLREVQLAVDSHLHILQFRIEDVPASDDLKYFLGTPHWLDALTPPLKRHLDHLSTAVQALLDVTGEVPVSSPSIAVNQSALASMRAPAPLETPLRVRRFHPAIPIGIVIGVTIFAVSIWFFTHRPAQEKLAVVQPTSSAPPPQSLESPSPTMTHRPTQEKLAAVQSTSSAPPPQSLESPSPTMTPAAPTLVNLGLLKLENGETEAAIIYFNRALEADPSGVIALGNRGQAKIFQGDLKGAFEDFDRALKREPGNPFALEGRAIARMVTGQWEDAASDLRARCAAQPATQDYWRLVLWIAASHLSDIAAANRELAEYMETRTPRKRPDRNHQVADFLMDKITVTKFLDPKGAFLKNDTKKLSQALMFAGMKRLSEGDKNGAISYFNDCVAQRQTTSLEFQLAQAELRSLRK